MTTFLASFLIFLGAAAALALRRPPERPSAGSCGGCAARGLGDCEAPEPARREAG